MDLLDTTLGGLNDVNNWIGRSQFVADEELQATLEDPAFRWIVQRVRQTLQPVGASKPDWTIICELARAMEAMAEELPFRAETVPALPAVAGIDLRRPRV